MGKSNNVSVLKPQDQLAELAQRIRTEHQAVVGAVRTGLEHAMAAGELLLKAKQQVSQVSHGQWGEWVSRHCEISERVAQMYMRVAENWAAIEAKAKPVSDLTLKGALRLIAVPPKAKTKPVSYLTPQATPVIEHKPKRVTHCDLLGLWTHMPAEERCAFFDGIGLRAIVEGIPDAWLGEMIEQLIERENPHKPQPKKTSRKKLAIPDDLSIPQFLVAAPANGEAADALAP
jgi:Protein of unknown function (DUF3102)